MVDLLQNPVHIWRNVQCVVNGTGRIKQNHTDNEYGQRKEDGGCRRPPLLKEAVAANSAMSMPIKCVIALPGSLILNFIMVSSLSNYNNYVM